MRSRLKAAPTTQCKPSSVKNSAHHRHRLPPALVIVAGYDPLRDEGIAYAERLKQAGNRVELTNYEAMVHPFFSMSRALDAGKQAIVQASAALKDAFATNDRSQDSRKAH